MSQSTSARTARSKSSRTASGPNGCSVRDVPTAKVLAPKAPQPDPRLTADSIHDLARSIEGVGLLQPIIVAERGDVYEVLAGRRRLAAVTKLGWQSVRVCIVPLPNEQHGRVIAVVENIQRADLDPMAEAEAVSALMDVEQDVDVVARSLGRSRAWVDARLQVAKLPDCLRAALRSRALSRGAALALDRIDDPATLEDLTRQAVLHGITASQAAIWAAAAHTPPSSGEEGRMEPSASAGAPAQPSSDSTAGDCPALAPSPDPENPTNSPMLTCVSCRQRRSAANCIPVAICHDCCAELDAALQKTPA